MNTDLNIIKKLTELNTISYSIFLVFDIRGLGIVKTVYLSTVIDLE